MKTQIQTYFALLSALLFVGLAKGQTTFNYTGNLQNYTVPAGVTEIQIEAWGAQGGGGLSGVTGGLGAYISGDFIVTPGQVITILVGGQGVAGTDDTEQAGGTGGGGSFVVDAGNNPLVVAGGGGGAMGRYNLLANGGPGQITTTGQNGALNGGAGGTSGGGGGTWPWSGWHSGTGGGGLLTNGSAPSNGSISYGTINGPGMAFVNGGAGGYAGSLSRVGGYGGGGSAGFTGGGGGGYSGGGSGTHDAPQTYNGGGGGSFNGGTNPIAQSGVRTGNGQVIITPLCLATSITADVTNLPNLNGECSVDTTAAPTATNSCGVTFSGTPDVSFPVSTFGVTTVTWTYTDGVNTVTQTQTITVSDTQAPVPDANSLPDLTDMCTVNSATPPTATDNCEGAIVGTTTTVFPVTTPGTTVITWTFDDGNGNVSTQTQNIVNPTVDVTVNQSGGTLTAVQNNATYSWLDCDNSFSPLSEYNQAFTATAITGNYAVEVNYNGCVDTSSCYLVDYTGINEQMLSDLMVYPNPSADGNFTILSGAVISQVRFFDVLGRELPCTYHVKTGLIQTGVKEAGTYFIHLYSEAGVAVREVQIQ